MALNLFIPIKLTKSHYLNLIEMQPNGEKDFNVGDELPVQCSSFTSKGIPVMSLVDEE